MFFPSEVQGIEMSKDAAREVVYGMPYSEWKEKYQTEATDSQKAAFASLTDADAKH